MINKLNNLISICEENGYMDKVIHPYGYSISIKDFTNHWKDYNNYTKDSQEVIEEEFYRLEKIINCWLKSEKEILSKLFGGE